MTETIESFVEKLQKEGVEAGQVQAKKIADEADAEGQRILSDAEKQAQAILDEARAEAQRIVSRGKDELELAARDVLLQLNKGVTDAIKATLEKAVETKMKDHEFLGKLIRDVVVQYAKEDAEGARSIEVRVSDEMLDAVAAWATGEIAGADGGAATIDLQGKLKSAGFEYSSAGGTIEVTAESIAGVLGEMVAPRLQETIRKAAKN